MKIIYVSTKTKKYPVYFPEEKEGLSECFLPENAYENKKVLVVTDTNLLKLYKDMLFELRKKVADLSVFIIEAGENSKTLSVCERITDTLAANKFTKADIVAAFGGGVVCDIAGFAASIYRRGTGLIMCPTSLLAMADASVGGKNGVDSPFGKNILGTVYQPDAVIINRGFLKTLPGQIRSEGMAEIIKAAVLTGDRSLSLYNAVGYKAEIVAEDEFDTGKRHILNLGHTIGHALELLSDYNVPHGVCVGIGLYKTAVLAEKHGLCDRETADFIEKSLRDNGLETGIENIEELKNITPEDLYNAVLEDKKISGDRLFAVIPRKMGAADITGLSFETLKKLSEEFFDE